MTQTNPTLDDVWRLFQETDRKFQETERLMKESGQETDRKFQETDQKLKALEGGHGVPTLRNYHVVQTSNNLAA